MAEFRIERARDADLPVLVAFAAAIQEHERATDDRLRPGEDIATAYTGWMTGQAKAAGGVILLARTGAECAGFTCAWPAEDEDRLVRPDCRAHGYVSDLFVAKTYRRLGLATALLQAAEAAMAARGCTRLRICAKAANQAALDCYAGFGFTAYEVILEKSISSAAAGV